MSRFRSVKDPLQPKAKRAVPRRWRRRALASLLSPAIFAGLLVGNASVSPAAAPTGAGFTITKGDISYIIEQIRIAEAHDARTNSTTGPCGAMIKPVGTATALPYQLDHAGLPFGLRTVDGSCNNLVQDQEYFATAAGFETNPATGANPLAYDYIPALFPRYADPVFRDAQVNTFSTRIGVPLNTSTTYNTLTSGPVVDTEPRTISNLISDQTVTNPAAIEAAGNPVRTQNAEGVFPCDIHGMPDGCTPAGETLFIENVTTDVGLSPPYNSMFTLFGQFFDHGIDQTVKGGGTVYMPLNADDPLIPGPDGILVDDPLTVVDEAADNLPPQLRFMTLSRGNQRGADGILGTADDERNAPNTNSPWVDQSQTYSSHASHQVFLREYEMVDGAPVSTGLLLSGRPVGAPEFDGPNHIDYGMATWEATKRQTAEKLGLLLEDKDVHEVPMIATDAYGNFVPGPLRGLPQYVTATGLVEGDLATPVAVPANVLKNDRPFLTDLAHHSNPFNSRGQALLPDPDLVATGDHLAHAAMYPAPYPLGVFGYYDDELLNTHFIAGDGRVNENIGLVAIHQVFHSEHDRVALEVDGIINAPGNEDLAAMMNEAVLPGTDIEAWAYGERLFQIARFITEMEYQHLVFEDFVRKMQPGLNPFTPAALIETNFDPAIHAEFAHAVYRFGHSMLTETIDRKNPDGSRNDISLLEGFLNPPEFFDGGPAGPLNAHDAAGAIVMGMSDQAGNELDEFMTDTLRNNLVGLPLDLGALNIARGRSEGVPPLNVFRRDVYNKTLNGELLPYTSWVDFGQNIKHPASLVNFVAAYGQHPTILAETTLAGKREAARLIVNPDVILAETGPADAADFLNSSGDFWSVNETGLNMVDLWIGGLAEVTSPFGGLLGTTFNFVFESDMTDLQNGDRFYYLTRTPGMSLQAQLEGNSFSEVLQRNTNSYSLKADAFSTSDCKFELANLDGTPAGFLANGNAVADDPNSECDEAQLLIRHPNGTIQYRSRNTVDPLGINGQSVFNGTLGVDRVVGGNDNDTFWGNASNDIIEGGAGADVAVGGEGNDILTDTIGDDVTKGGPGNDAIDTGPGLDIGMGGDGQDFMLGGQNTDGIFGGTQDDFIHGGEGLDEVVAGDGDDWIQGGPMQDLLIGDSMNFFFLDNSSTPGADIFIGQGGDDDYDMEGGDDVSMGGPGIEKNAGQSGWDSMIAGSPGQGGDNLPLHADIRVPIVNQNVFVTDTRDRFDEVEALSGGNLNDVLFGDDIVPRNVINVAGDIGRNWIRPETLALFSGLADVLPAGTNLNPADGIVWGDGNILLGGAGSDTMTGRGANDIIDGDRYLNVRLSVRTNPAVASSEIGTTDLMESFARPGGHFGPGTAGMTLQHAVFAGLVDPGNIVAVREVLMATDDGELDVAAFQGQLAEYDISFANGAVIVNHINPVAAPGGLGGGGVLNDGIDIVRNVERLQFVDQSISLIAPGAPTINAATPGDGSALVAFTPAAPNAGPAVTSFEIVVTNITTSGTTTITGIAPTVTEFLVTGLTNGDSYEFAVRAVNPTGVSPLSASFGPVTPAPDNTAPTLVSSSPVNGATNVSATADLALVLSEVVSGISTATVTLRQGISEGGAVVPAVVTFNSGTRTITVNPTADLQPGTVYTLRTLIGLNDAAVNPLAPQTITFTTAGNTPPTVIAATPAANSVGLGRNDNATITFSEPIQGASAATAFLTRVSNGNVVVSVVTLNVAGNTITINPNGRLRANTQYQLNLVGGATAIRDLDGQPLVTTSWTFTTGAA